MQSFFIYPCLSGVTCLPSIEIYLIFHTILPCSMYFSYVFQTNYQTSQSKITYNMSCHSGIKAGSICFIFFLIKKTTKRKQWIRKSHKEEKMWNPIEFSTVCSWIFSFCLQGRLIKMCECHQPDKNINYAQPWQNGLIPEFKLFTLFSCLKCAFLSTFLHWKQKVECFFSIKMYIYNCFERV